MLQSKMVTRIGPEGPGSTREGLKSREYPFHSVHHGWSDQETPSHEDMRRTGSGLPCKFSVGKDDIYPVLRDSSVG